MRALWPKGLISAVSGSRLHKPFTAGLPGKGKGMTPPVPLALRRRLCRGTRPCAPTPWPWGSPASRARSRFWPPRPHIISQVGRWGRGRGPPCPACTVKGKYPFSKPRLPPRIAPLLPPDPSNLTGLEDALQGLPPFGFIVICKIPYKGGSVESKHGQKTIVLPNGETSL